MADTGWLANGGVALFGSGTTWNGTSNLVASDNFYATCALDGGEQSRQLTLQGFGVSLPNGTYPVGAEVKMERKTSSFAIGLEEVLFKLRDSGSTSPANRISFNPWSTNDTTVTRGSPTDDWGYGTTFTKEFVEHPSFGMVFQIENTNIKDTITAFIDQILIKIYYKKLPSSQISGVRLKLGLGL